MKRALPEKAALRLLERWEPTEKALHASLQTDTPAEQRAAIRRVATYFRVVRNLRRSPEIAAGVPRFEPVRQCLATIAADDLREGRFEEVVSTLARAVAVRYGGKYYLSLASKLLWMKFRHPVVIYDSIVRNALGTPRGDYQRYVAAWHDLYAREAIGIARACEGLMTPIASEEWFRRRVLDILIVDVGS